MSYQRRLANGILVRSTRAEDADALEALQVEVFPTLADSERFKREHYLSHIEMFPEGQLVAVDGTRVVGMTSTIRLSFDFEHPRHAFADIFGGGWLSVHDPEGDWLYGADVGTHPDYRRRGIARGLYAARQELVRRLGLRGQVTVGMLRGYGAVKDAMSAEAYYQAVVRGERSDPTLTSQLRIGFEPTGLVPDYLDDPACGNCGVLLVLPRDHAIDAP
jgi:GNAT superfamily N-acetyltransferase